ncbi:copper resistance CopC family protein [Solicola gregarius]|uniref:Copper resistance protein CopC n=1 Tax=Solicola gregarius TaxID=2908642 RepID=A0AA46THA7_9ACTN|nr:copper resistance CopC family protein [Solicola gregarius]UYM05151.1 copper resistance protein CopC [Solicola gregarius]
MSLRLPAAVIAALFLVLIQTAGPAFAHATLVRSDPKDGAALDSEPTTVSLTFNEDVSTPAQLQVTAPDGAPLASKAPTVDGTEVSQSIDTANLAGTYTIAYRVISADGHPITGELTYEVTSGKQVGGKQESDDESFAERHATHLAIGGAAVVVAVGLLIWPRIRRRA